MTFPKTTFSWQIRVEFDSDVASFMVWLANTREIDSRNFLLENKSSNGHVLSGTTMKLGFGTRFEYGTPPPDIVALSLSGEYVCGM